MGQKVIFNHDKRINYVWELALSGCDDPKGLFQPKGFCEEAALLGTALLLQQLPEIPSTASSAAATWGNLHLFPGYFWGKRSFCAAQLCSGCSLRKCCRSITISQEQGRLNQQLSTTIPNPTCTLKNIIKAFSTDANKGPAISSLELDEVSA